MPSVRVVPVPQLPHSLVLQQPRLLAPPPSSPAAPRGVRDVITHPGGTLGTELILTLGLVIPLGPSRREGHRARARMPKRTQASSVFRKSNRLASEAKGKFVKFQ